MECNRDEALRAKEHAERKITEKDYVGAKKFALKAQSLSQSLEGIAQMLTTLDVYLASDAKVNGESDWYAVLHVNASADEETVKKQYRKLALLLHPDKNKSAGAEGAFQLVSEAWNVLSDKNKKMVYDQKISVKSFYQRPSQPSNNSSAPSATNNGFYQFTNSTVSKSKAQKSNSHRPLSAYPPQAHPPPHTFWTSCTGCCMQYEYHRMYLNKSLLCPKCKQPFLAIELPVASVGHNHPQWHSKQHNLNAKHKSAYKNSSALTGMGISGFNHGLNADSYTNTSFQWPPFSFASAGVNETSSAVKQAANVVHHAYEKTKRQREEAQATTKKEESLRRKLSRRVSSGFENLYAGFGADKCATRTCSGADSGKNENGEKSDLNTSCRTNTIPEVEKSTSFYDDSLKSRLSSRPTIISREFSQVNAKEILMEKARVQILKKIQELDLVEAAKTKDIDRVMKKQKTHDAKLTKVVNKENVMCTVHEESVDVATVDDPRNKNGKVPNKEARQNNFITDSIKVDNQPMSIDVPDSDFYDFDKNRTEKAFGDDQVWATYDDDDGMPRYYAYIQKFISAKPFKVRMSFLTSKSTVEFGSLDWVGSGFCKTCGDFRIGRYSVITTINIFSHRVRWEKGFRGVIKVLPRKGDIWALYRNWDPDWNEHTPDHVIHKYEMVEVLEDYNEDHGILVVPLVKVIGFRTVFLRHMDSKENKMIPKEEMFRFSHQLPHYLLTGEEAHNAPKDCLELDPAATPLELLQVLTETKDEERKNDDEQKPIA